MSILSCGFNGMKQYFQRKDALHCMMPGSINVKISMRTVDVSAGMISWLLLLLFKKYLVN